MSQRKFHQLITNVVVLVVVVVVCFDLQSKEQFIIKNRIDQRLQKVRWLLNDIRYNMQKNCSWSLHQCINIDNMKSTYTKKSLKNYNTHLQVTSQDCIAKSRLGVQGTMVTSKGRAGKETHQKNLAVVQGPFH